MSKEPINLTGYEMKPVAWKLYEVEDGVVYRIQFDEVPWKFKKTLQQAMSDWHASLYGWHKTTGNQLFAFNKKFKSLEDWERWAERFPMQITEKRVWGDRERIILHGKKRTKNG